ncbi:hypothetical protein [uncultured Winogradskyella sp.]|uniref:hypothetical protein n=1 Tax=uncultured Winogradskyella sp. TaxID=395353 RepID=UPI0035125E3F
MKRFFLLIMVLATLACSNDDSITPNPIPQVIAEFRPNLSELNLFTGDLSDLNISPAAFEYKLNTELFTDYAHKQRIIALPEGSQMQYDGDGLPIFPDNTVIAKTFYYNNDERDLTLGRRIIETRLLIKINGVWQTGDYKWTEDQTEAVLDLNGSTVAVNWTDATGTMQTIDYEIPSNTDCFTCHNSYDNVTPIGPKLRNLNFDISGSNQLQVLINSNYITGLDSANDAGSIVDWEDTSLPLEERARAYLDVNCAHCHIPGGFCEDLSILDLDYATSLADSKIVERRFNISARMSTNIPDFSMPLIGTSIIHTEGYDLIQAYLDTL